MHFIDILIHLIDDILGVYLWKVCRLNADLPFFSLIMLGNR